MPDFHELSVVRVKALIRGSRHWKGWALEKDERSPRVGDRGTVVHIFTTAGKPTLYLVEGSDPIGVPIWLSDFLAEELELDGLPQNLVQQARLLAGRDPLLEGRLEAYRAMLHDNPQCPICWMEDELHADLSAAPTVDSPTRHVCTLHGEHVFRL